MNRFDNFTVFDISNLKSSAVASPKEYQFRKQDFVTDFVVKEIKDTPSKF